MSQLPYFLSIFIIFAPICREIFTLSFEIMVILDWTSPLNAVSNTCEQTISFSLVLLIGNKIKIVNYVICRFKQLNRIFELKKT